VRRELAKKKIVDDQRNSWRREKRRRHIKEKDDSFCSCGRGGKSPLCAAQEKGSPYHLRGKGVLRGSHRADDETEKVGKEKGMPGSLTKGKKPELTCDLLGEKPSLPKGKKRSETAERGRYFPISVARETLPLW